uniref:J domain-containing protein n=1 Tax=Amphora coffeiformis TaxID=265554 RepID=A0A7S3L828_9STRA
MTRHLSASAVATTTTTTTTKAACVTILLFVLRMSVAYAWLVPKLQPAIHHRPPHQIGSRVLSTTVPWQYPPPHGRHVTASTTTTTTRLFQSSSVDPHVIIDTSTDPFQILGLAAATADKAEIKRAYKRMALRFHPDVVCHKDSTPAERKAAGDRFAKINAAYETLSGKGSSSSGSSGSSGGTSQSTTTGTGSRSSSSSSSSWEPPHRRKGPYTSSSSSSTTGGASTDWRDYIPKNNKNYDNDDAQYDAGGDSFGQIFADLIAGAAAAGVSSAGRSGGIFQDFVEFLETNLEGGGVAGASASADDAALRLLLQTGTLQQVADEMDDTALLVEQLEVKTRTLQDEIWTLEAELRLEAIRYSQRIQLQEQVEELQARQRVVQGYERKARKRLVALQTRYKELIVRGDDDVGVNDDMYGRNTSRGRKNANGPSASYGSPSSSSSSSYGSTASSSPSSSSAGDTTRESTDDNTRATTNPEDAWKSEGFGSFGRRGSSRGRSRRPRPSSRPTESVGSGYSSSTAANTRSSYASSSSSSKAANSSSSSNPYNPSQTPSSNTYSKRPTTPQTAQDPYLPPHRRTKVVDDDKRRLRDLQVDEEFDKLKREMGL